MTGGTITATTTQVEVFNAVKDGGQVGAVRVKNSTTSTTNVQVNVPGLHATAEFDVLEPGDEGIYRYGANGIQSVRIQAASGTPTVNFSVIGKNIGPVMQQR